MKQLTQEEIANLEQLEVYKFWLLLFAGVFTVSSLIISSYINMKKPGV